CSCRDRTSVEGRIVLREGWLLRRALWQEVSGPERPQSRSPSFHVEFLFNRLEKNSVADSAHPHFFPRQPEFLGKSDGLTTALHENLCRSFFGHACDPLIAITDRYHLRAPMQELLFIQALAGKGVCGHPVIRYVEPPGDPHVLLLLDVVQQAPQARRAAG